MRMKKTAWKHQDKQELQSCPILTWFIIPCKGGSGCCSEGGLWDQGVRCQQTEEVGDPGRRSEQIQVVGSVQTVFQLLVILHSCPHIQFLFV